MLIRNILIAFTTSCVSIFDISNDILYTSSFSHYSFTSSTANNADFRLTQILHVPLYFIGQKFSHEQIQHGLLFTKRIAWFVAFATSTLYFPTVWNLVSVFKKISPFYFFYGAFWSKIGDLNSHPQFGKLMCWPLTLILHIKVGSQALPVPYLTWFFWRDGFTTNSPLVLTTAFTQVTREGLLDFHIYNMTKKTSDLPLNAKNTPTFVLKAGAFLRLYQFLVWLFHHYFIVKQRHLLE